MNLWVDDLRPAPDGWTWAKTSSEALAILAEHTPKAISLDHDLGGDDTTRPIVRWMAEHNRWPQTIAIHTRNPVGREYLHGMVWRYAPAGTRPHLTG